MIDNSSTSPAPMVPAQTLLETARAYWEAGLTPMPRLPGEVNPHYLTDDGDVRAIGWGSYKQKQPAWSTVERWFRLGSLATVGVTLLTGSHEMPRSADAACLQILDIETAELFEAFMEEVRFLGHEEILNRCTIERTASAGGHLGFLCATISDKQKLPLARRADHKILIELLQHQPCTVAPTQIRCKETHAEGAAYTLMHGTWAHPQVLSPAQRQIIIDVARRYTEVPEKVAAEPGEHTTGTRPGDVLGERADIAWWQDLLTRHDWHDVSRPGWARSGVYYFRRPGKVGHAVSATYGRTGPTLYVFSSNAFPFEAETAYTPFAAYTLLEHGGDYQAAARALAQLYGLDQRRNGQGPGPEPTDAHACPALPAYAQTNEASAAQASLFLDDYIQISTQWAPRAYEGFHEAVALFLLSTLAARRIKILFGSRGTYTSLYIAMAARTTIYTKSTTADIGLALLDAAGLSWLLADDDSTPQAFLRSLSLYVPSNYAQLPPEEQDLTRHQLAFAGQRGWFYEEWGGHLEAMMQKNGYMAGFRSILRRLDDHKVRYASSTIARGREILHKPYVSLLANVTPSDLQPFVKARSPLWRDGYIARFAFVTPDQGEGSAAEFPEGSLTFPGYLVTTLQHWHKRLGVPTCILTPKTDKKGQPTEGYTIDVDPLPEKAYTLSPEVRTAYYDYDRAMRDLTRQRGDEDLDGSYGRFPAKALRIAGLLASLHDDSGKYTIWPRHWWRGQQIAERWRQGLHRLRQQVQTQDTPTSPRRQLEEKLLRQAQRSGPQTLRDFATYQKTHSREEIEAGIKMLVAAGDFVEYPTP